MMGASARRSAPETSYSASTAMDDDNNVDPPSSISGMLIPTRMTSSLSGYGLFLVGVEKRLVDNDDGDAAAESRPISTTTTRRMNDDGCLIVFFFLGLMICEPVCPNLRAL